MLESHRKDMKNLMAEREEVSETLKPIAETARSGKSRYHLEEQV